MKDQFHIYSMEELYSLLQSGEDGLSETEANSRRARYGSNELTEAKQRSPWSLLMAQFLDVLIVILLAAAVLSGILGDIVDTVIILVIVVVNALIGFYQEYNAEKAMAALRKMAVMNAKVRRGSDFLVIPSSELVPGDVVMMEAGMAVPADMRLIEAHGLRVDESALTGESIAVDKNSAVLSGDFSSLGDRLNMLYKGTLVTTGRATALVVSTGMHTELGKIAGLLQEEDADTPLKKRMNRFGKLLSLMILLICILIFVAGWLRGEDLFTMLLLSISLAVAAIPEALPALITVALSQGASRMARKNALIRKLPAVETLGSVSHICSDKTGTLTVNRMKLVQKQDTGAKLSDGLSALALGMALNHDVQFNQDNLEGDPTETALVQGCLDECGLQTIRDWQKDFIRVAEIPFDSDRKCMSTIHRLGDRYLVLTKGASESIAGLLADKKSADELHRLSEDWAGDGLRVIGYAYKLMDQLPNEISPAGMENGMTWSGTCGLIDPPREEVKAAIRECRTAGIKPVMITGDHPATATAIARQIGIMDENDRVLSGAQLSQLSDGDFVEQVDQIAVFARVSPDQKLRIVRALQHKGNFVAMTGDGVNDAPSLKAANIGVAMGINGTDVSKEASDMILLDDHYQTIVVAVKEGRRIFDNIRKFVRYIMTCNSAEIWTIVLAPFLGMPIPLLPIHILWINLVTDGLPGLALAGEKAEPDIMKRTPRPPGESLFSDGLGFHIFWVGLLMAGVTLATQAVSIASENTHWQTMVFTVLSLSQLAHALAIRSERSYLFSVGIFSNRPLLGAIVLAFALQLLVIYVPFLNVAFRTEPLSLPELGFCILVSVAVFHAVELEKWIRHHRRKQQVI